MGGCESAASDPPTLGPAPSPVNHLTCQSLLCIVFCFTFNFTPSLPPSQTPFLYLYTRAETPFVVHMCCVELDSL